MNEQRIELLQAGRGVAAVAVALCHSGTYVGHRFGTQFFGLAVEFFFLLSGFIIYRITAGRPFDIGQYAWKRARRIFIPYWPVGLAMVGLYLAQGRDFSLLASITLLPGETALHPAWSLQHELAFYALAAFALLIRAPLTVMAIWAIAIVLRNLAPAPLGEWEQVLLSSRNLAFVAGMFMGALVTIPDIRVGRMLNLLGNASYSIYLAHLPVMGVLWRLGFGFWTLAIGGLLAGLAYYRFVERPLLARVSNHDLPPITIPSIRHLRSKLP